MAGNLTFKDVLRILMQILYILLIIYIIYQVLRILLGGTWVIENIVIAGMGIILSGLFVIVGFLINQGRSLGILEERTKNIGESLSNLGKDFKEHLESHRR